MHTQAHTHTHTHTHTGAHTHTQPENTLRTGLAFLSVIPEGSRYSMALWKKRCKSLCDVLLKGTLLENLICPFEWSGLDRKRKKVVGGGERFKLQDYFITSSEKLKCG